MKNNFAFVRMVQIDFSTGDRISLEFSIGMKLIWLCGSSKMTSSQCNWSALIRFLCSGRKQLTFSVRIEINWVFVSG